MLYLQGKHKKNGAKKYYVTIIFEFFKILKIVTQKMREKKYFTCYLKWMLEIQKSRFRINILRQKKLKTGFSS